MFRLEKEVRVPVEVELLDKSFGDGYKQLGEYDDDPATGRLSKVRYKRVEDAFEEYEGSAYGAGFAAGVGYSTARARNGIKLSEFVWAVPYPAGGAGVALGAEVYFFKFKVSLKKDAPKVLKAKYQMSVMNERSYYTSKFPHEENLLLNEVLTSDLID